MFCVLQLTRGLRNRNIASEQYPDHPSPKGSSVQPKLADSLSAQALLARPLKTDLSAIPKLFHQSWSSKTLPAKFERWSQSCRRAHPDWKWVLWTDQDNFDLVRKYAPWFLDTYEMLGSRIPVYQADLVRNLYMHVYGGVYADLDIECLRPTETLLKSYGKQGRQAFLGRMGLEDSNSASLPNAWFASSPGHPFWLLPLEYAKDNAGTIENPEALTGPGALFRIVGEYNDKYSNGWDLEHHYAQSGWRDTFPRSVRKPASQTLTILPFWEIYPYSWERDGAAYREYCWTRMEKFDETMCKLLLGTDHWGSHTITYWSHSWGDDGGGHDEKGFKSVLEDTSQKRQNESLVPAARTTE